MKIMKLGEGANLEGGYASLCESKSSDGYPFCLCGLPALTSSTYAEDVRTSGIDCGFGDSRRARHGS